MKTKDLGFFTKHVEKIIIAAGVLLLGVILLLYVVGNPYAVTVKGKQVDAVALEQEIDQTANQLSTKLSTYREFPEIAVYPWGVNFQARMEDSPSSVEELPGSIGRLGLGPDANVEVVVPEPFDLPRPPLPTNPTVNASYAVFDPQAGQENLDPQDVQAIFQVIGSPSPSMPADFAYVSVQGEFDLDEWVSRLESSSARNPVPRAFWRGKQVITAVYLQRQELNPVTGEWSEPVIVDPLPTQQSFTPQFTRNYTDQEARAFIEFIKQTQEQIARPPFVPLAAHARQWLPPENAGNLTPEQHRELDKLNGTIARLEKAIKMTNEQMARAAERALQQQQRGQGRPQAVPRAVPMDYGDEMDMGGPSGRGGGLPPTRAPGVAPGGNNLTREQEVQEKLQRDIADLAEAKRQLNELLGVELDVLGGTGLPGMSPEDMMMYQSDMMYEMDPYGGYGGYGGPYGQPGYGGYAQPGYGGPMGPTPIDPRTGRPMAGARAPGRGMPGEEPAAVDPAAPVDRVISVWAHDLTVERGKTYRYRLLVSVMNPLFREARVEEQQKSENFNKLSLGPAEEELAEMPWSDPVEVDPAYQFFFTAGTAQQQFAQIEVWRFYDGKPWSEEFTVYPGDPIGGEATIDGTTIDMTVGAVMVDLVSQASAGRGGLGGGNSTKLLFIEPGSPQIQSRSLDQDKNSDDRLRLENERRIIETLTAGVASTAP